MNFDSLYHPYSSRRFTHFARNGMVATSQPLAASAGLEILKTGGNAIDAAVAMAACLTVVEPTSNGIGSDAFALIWTEGGLHGLNASGPAPAEISLEDLTKRNLSEMPMFGFDPVTVPGAPAAWATLSERFGNLSLTKTLTPAIAYAQSGFPISPILGDAWKRSLLRYRRHVSGPAFDPLFDLFAPEGRAPGIGEMWASPEHAESLRLIAETGAEAFYRGPLAEEIDAFSREHGGYLRASDLEQYTPDWVDPIGINYRGFDVWEMPPNGQGLVALMALNILKGFELSEKDTVRTYHHQIEALKLAFVDGMKYITDPDRMSVSVADLLSDAYADERRRLINRDALDPAPGSLPQGGTVYLATADGDGNMVSLIQSNYMGFGSGIVIPKTGIGLQNRGANFSLDPSHDNCLAPGKRTYHTIIPGFLTQNKRPIGPFGVMGGFMQPQGHVQVISNAIDFKLNPQAALDAPRWQWQSGRKIRLEHGVPEHIALALDRRGHDISWALSAGGFGRGQIIWQLDNGVLAGGTEPRTDGAVLGW